ncbi:MAG: CapA family protein [Syntrophomonadaceae bacterium]
MKKGLAGCSLIALVLTGYLLLEGTKEDEVYVPAGSTITVTEPRTETVSLVAVGDCLMHNTQIWSGEQPDGSYCFDHFFSDVAHLIKEADYSSVTFEAPMAGPKSGYTGYPLFNSPDAMAQAFKNAGFDLIVTSNNHSLDRGVQGALRTLDVLQAAQLDTIGTYRNEAESQISLIKDIRGVKIGYLAYTYGTNGIPVPADKPYLINLLEEDRVINDVSTLRPLVDILVVILHWGVEYAARPTEAQVELAHKICQAGADVILGSHPHVIQTMEVFQSGDKDKFIIYSMGNFISHQIGLERNSGIVLNLKFTKNFDRGETWLQEVSYIPTYSHPFYINGRMYFRVVPVQEAMERIMEGTELYLGSQDLPTLQNVWDSTTQQLQEPFVKSPDI